MFESLQKTWNSQALGARARLGVMKRRLAADGLPPPGAEANRYPRLDRGRDGWLVCIGFLFLPHGFSKETSMHAMLAVLSIVGILLAFLLGKRMGRLEKDGD